MEPTTGRCLCGSVRFEIDGPLRDVSLCHCVECRRWHGHVCAMTSAPRERVRFVSDDGLRWTYERIVRSSDGIVPDRHAFRARFRAYFRLF